MSVLVQTHKALHKGTDASCRSIRRTLSKVGSLVICSMVVIVEGWQGEKVHVFLRLTNR